MTQEKDTQARAFALFVERPPSANPLNSQMLAMTVTRSQLVNNPGKIGLPGGRVDEGESVHQAVLREVREEIGVIVPENLPYVRICPDDVHNIFLFTWSPPEPKRSVEVSNISWIPVYRVLKQILESPTDYHKSLKLAIPYLLYFQSEITLETLLSLKV
jgi:8-oxo-dGTP pyrophosphatase MutT (NUDIX family)